MKEIWVLKRCDKNVENNKQFRESKACPLVYQRGHREDTDTEWNSKE